MALALFIVLAAEAVRLARDEGRPVSRLIGEIALGVFRMHGASCCS
ncbi:MAG: hypothetical protein ACXVPL_05605 [Actinomycetota bacterium]